MSIPGAPERASLKPTLPWCFYQCIMGAEVYLKMGGALDPRLRTQTKTQDRGVHPTYIDDDAPVKRSMSVSCLLIVPDES